MPFEIEQHRVHGGEPADGPRDVDVLEGVLAAVALQIHEQGAAAGPAREGGDQGGKIIATGTPEQVARVKKSYTGQALTSYFKGSEINRAAKNGWAKNASAKGVLAPTGTGELV